MFYTVTVTLVVLHGHGDARLLSSSGSGCDCLPLLFGLWMSHAVLYHTIGDDNFLVCVADTHSRLSRGVLVCPLSAMERP